MRILVWHWGRFGAGPRYAAQLTQALRSLSDATVPTAHQTVARMQADLSLPVNAEILHGPNPPCNSLPVRTYASLPGFIARVMMAPFRVGALARRVRALHPEFAICAMPAMLDVWMVAALRRVGVPFAVVVHDAAPHPGERVPFQHYLQRYVIRRADALVALTEHVAASVRTLPQAQGKPLCVVPLPPLHYGAVPMVQAHGGPCRVLCFGRLLAYKGLDLLADALRQLSTSHARFQVRVVGQGPESPVLEQLRALPGVTVENRWVPETEIPQLLGWCDIVVLPYREASQSGVAATALAAGRRVVATRVGGLVEQLHDQPHAVLCAPQAQDLARALTQARGQVVAGPAVAGGDLADACISADPEAGLPLTMPSAQMDQAQTEPTQTDPAWDEMAQRLQAALPGFMRGPGA